MQTIQELYQNSIFPLDENERLKLIELIVRDIASRKPQFENKKKIREMFGSWQGKSPISEEYRNMDHNERIDFDLARAYAETHEDED